MFGGGTSTEYDEIVAKTTDENLTSENWELILNLCDKVGEEGQEGAHAVIVAILKRLTHRNPNVQLYALSLSESLGKNLGIEIHREIASKAFIQGLEKLITDRNTHEKVRKRALGVIAEWVADFESDSSLSIMEDCYNNLKAKNYKFEQPQESPPPSVDDEIRRKEEEELQRVLEMSKQDRGGRARWDEYSLATSTSAGPSGSAAAASSSSAAASSSSPSGYTAPKYQGGYAPARTPSPDRVAAEQRQQQLEYQKQLLAQQQAQAQQAKEEEASKAREEEARKTREEEARKTREEEARQQAAAAAAVAAAPAVATTTTTASTSLAPNVNIVTRVRALYTFEPTEPGELAFDKGDVIKVVDRGYKDWWRGQLKGRTGIFPVNYVEPMPEPTASELAKESEQEAVVFSQAVNVEKLLNMLRAFDPVKDNLADNEEIQELYRSSMALRPKIVKLIDKYSQKRADLVSMNETFLRARTIFDRMMEESLARHTGIYDQPTYRPPPSQYGPPILQGRPGSRNSMAVGSPHPFSWGPGYDQQQVPLQQPPSQQGYNAYPGPAGPAPPFPSVTPQPLGLAPGQPQMQPTNYAAVAQQGPVPQQPQPQPQPQQPQPQVTATGPPAGYGVMPVGGYAGHQANMPYGQQGPTPYPTQLQPQQQPNLAIQQPQPPVQPQAQQLQPQVQQSQPQVQQPQPQGQPNQPYQPPQQLVQQPQPQPQPQQTQPQPQPHQPTDIQPAQVQPQPVEIEQHDVQTPSQAHFQPQPQQVPVFAQPQPEPQLQPVQEPVVQAQPLPQQQPQPEPQAHLSQSIPPQPISGPPPYPFDASYTYADQNAQAWANYYAQGGMDPAGSVYFISVPGVKEDGPASNLNQPSQQVLQQQNGSPRQSYATQVLQPEQQTPSRTTSYRAQLQPLQGQVKQEQSQAHRTAEMSFFDPVGGLSNAASGVGLQATANMPRYHLSDNPVPQSHPQGAHRGEPSRAGSGDSASEIPPSSPSNFTSTAPLNIKRAQSPSTPSWVLPKKTNAPGFSPHGHGGSPPSGGSYFQTVGSG